MAFGREVKNGQAAKGHTDPNGILVERPRIVWAAMRRATPIRFSNSKGCSPERLIAKILLFRT